LGIIGGVHTAGYRVSADIRLDSRTDQHNGRSNGDITAEQSGRVSSDDGSEQHTRPDYDSARGGPGSDRHTGGYRNDIEPDRDNTDPDCAAQHGSDWSGEQHPRSLSSRYDASDHVRAEDDNVAFNNDHGNRHDQLNDGNNHDRNNHDIRHYPSPVQREPVTTGDDWRRRDVNKRSGCRINGSLSKRQRILHDAGRSYINESVVYEPPTRMRTDLAIANASVSKPTVHFRAALMRSPLL
jgi:hypothetical protein